MAVRVVSKKPVTMRKHVCVSCGYELEFNNIDLVNHRTDSDGDPVETRGKYIVCPRDVCMHRNLVDSEKRI